MIVLELVPEELSQIITRQLSCCIIGIGSGRNLDGEVQVVNDILGITERTFRHTKHFLNSRADTLNAFSEFIKQVKQRRFPEENNVTPLPQQVLEKLNQFIELHNL